MPTLLEHLLDLTSNTVLELTLCDISDYHGPFTSCYETEAEMRVTAQRDDPSFGIFILHIQRRSRVVIGRNAVSVARNYIHDV